MMIRTLLFSALALACNFRVSAQEDYAWWNELHQWDGVTPWNQYLVIAPKYFGPNALPVPEVGNGRADSLFKFEAAVGGHYSRGDKTSDALLRFVAPFCDGRVSLAAAVVPVEFYRMDTVTRDVRAARDRDGRGRAGGDIHFTTCVQLVRDHEIFPDVALEIALRTASGTRLGAARYTDGPGYHMDVSFGKSIVPSEGHVIGVRTYFMAGFYSYQTFDVQQLQNDCILYAAGFDLSNEDIVWSHQLAGYSGYKHNGDQPLVYRSNFRWIGRRLDGLLQIQVGLHDFEYRSIHTGVCWKLPIHVGK